MVSAVFRSILCLENSDLNLNLLIICEPMKEVFSS